jgi:Family of unknown function (DUF6055)
MPRLAMRNLGGAALLAAIQGCAAPATDDSVQPFDGAQPDAEVPRVGDGGVPVGSPMDAGVPVSLLDGGAGTAADGAVSADGGVSDGGDPGVPDAAQVDAGIDNPVCDPPPDPSTYRLNTVGGGGSPVTESDHFRIFGSGDSAGGLKLLEAAHQCFVVDWCWRSPGLSITRNKDVYNKFNVNIVADLGANTAGNQGYDGNEGLAFLNVVPAWVADSRVIVHEFGHAMTLSATPEGGWIYQTRTGAWWETVANWVADTFRTSPYCQSARDKSGVGAADTMINIDKVVNNSHLLIVSTQNYYDAWPFLTYLTHNPDHYPGLGRMVLPDLFKNHQRNNETPLHVLERLAAPVSVQQILGRYWARMAYLDIGHPKAQQAFLRAKATLNQANVDSLGNGTWRVKAARQPQYGGASIIPLKGSGQVTIKVTNLGNGLGESDFRATLSVRNTATGAVRYIDLPDGAGEGTVAAGEEASLVVANTPTTLYQYDAFNAGAPETTGLNWQVQLSGGLTP